MQTRGLPEWQPWLGHFVEPHAHLVQVWSPCFGPVWESIRWNVIWKGSSLRSTTFGSFILSIKQPASITITRGWLGWRGWETHEPSKRPKSSKSSLTCSGVSGKSPKISQLLLLLLLSRPHHKSDRSTSMTRLPRLARLWIWQMTSMRPHLFNKAWPEKVIFLGIKFAWLMNL